MERIALLKASAVDESRSIRQQLGDVEGSVESVEEDLVRQFRQVYTAGRGRGIRLLLGVEDPSLMLRGMAYLDAMARRQAATLASLKEGKRTLESLDGSLREHLTGIESLAGQERDKAIQLESVRREAAALLSATREESASHRRALEELTRAAEDLESAIVSGLAARSGSGPVTLDVEALKGVLEWPVEGRVSVPFGDIRHKQFGTVTPHNGLDIETPPGTPVRAVLGGIVVFGQRFSGYGNTVLIDHGSGYISVYARLASFQVTEGDEVLPRQTIGPSGLESPGGGAPTVYFEFRRDGKAVDPAAWLKRRKMDRRERGR